MIRIETPKSCENCVYFVAVDDIGDMLGCNHPSFPDDPTEHNGKCPHKHDGGE